MVGGIIAALVVGRTAPWVMVAVAAGVVLYGLFGVPLWCRARNRDGTQCRNNAYGLLAGCSLRQHKWQKLRPGDGSVLRRVTRGWWASPTACLATVGTLVSIVAGLMGIVQGIAGGN